MSDSEENSQAAAVMEKIKAKRAVMRSKATRDINAAKTNFADITEDNVFEAEVMVTKLRSHLLKLGEVDVSLFDLLSAEDIAQEADRALDYSEKLEDVISRIELRVKVVQQQASVQTTPAAGSKQTSAVKTPKLELTKFSGDPLRWEEFWDDFTCSVDARADLSTIDKFKILKQSLEGEALSVVNGYYLTQNNYSEVKAALKDRFGDPQVAIFAHFEALLDLKQASHDLEQLIAIRDKCEAHIRSLCALGLSEDTFGLVFAPILLSKLPRFVKMELHRRNGSKKWTLSSLREHLKEEIRARTKSERCYSAAPGDSDGKTRTKGADKQGKKESGTASALVVRGSKKGKKSATTSSRTACVFCDGQHKDWECSKYSTVDERKSRLHGRCFNCLSRQHQRADCRSKRSCYYCEKQGHHSSLCYQKFGGGGEKSNVLQSLNPKAPEFVPNSARAVQDRKAGRKSGTAVMESALVKVKGSKGTSMARLVFDTASSITLVRRDLSRKIGAKPLGDIYTSISGVFDTKQGKYPLVDFKVTLKDGSLKTIEAREMENISSPMRLVPLNMENAKPQLDISELADVLVDTPVDKPIEVLIGLDYYSEFVGPEELRYDNGIVVKRTLVGKILTGYLVNDGPAPPMQTYHQLLLQEDKLGDGAVLENFWRLENLGITDDPGLVDDEVALETFNQTVGMRDGRYEVQWPFKTQNPDLPDTYGLALQRLRSVYRGLEKDPELLRTYDKTLKDQLAINVIEPAPEQPQGVVFYLPHHAVVTPSRTTTKVRVVFDASAKPNKHAQSLNECMYRGPVFLNDLCGLLLRFRLPKVAIASDVEKAFLQISLQQEHRDCTRFLWLKDPQKPPTKDNIIALRYTRVPFGVKASPFILAATIIHHMKQAGSVTAKQIADNTYIDNVFGGVNSTDAAKRYYIEAKDLFNQMSMNLREWYSNDANFLKAVSNVDRGSSKEPSVLGVKWSTEKDVIRCSGGKIDCPVLTKRTILQAVASVYDPCGWFCPIVVRGKVMLQSLWKVHVDWDQSVPESISKAWPELAQDLSDIGKHEMPRLVSWPVAAGAAGQSYQLHVFCDASSSAYAACVYLRATSKGKIRSDLLFAKSRVAPIKLLTIPRLELMAAVIGTRVLLFVREQLQLPVKSMTLWTDSACVLGWIKSDKVTTVFVENRVRELRKVKDVDYLHVKTTENPADLPSRGVPMKVLQDSRLWWNGPTWLSKPEASWRPQPIILPKTREDGSPEDGIVQLAAATSLQDALFDIPRYSSLRKLLRVTCFLFRAVSRFKGQRSSVGPLTSREMDHAETFWILREQKLHFKNLLSPDACAKDKNLVKQLGVFRSADQMLRCRGRYGNSESLTPEAKLPCLLPTESPFTILVIKDCHAKVLHSGLKHTLAQLWARYWVCRARSVTKGVLKDCRLCRRYTGGPFRVPDPPPLPNFRSSVRRPFECVGLDYLGPLVVKASNGERSKVWIALFTCAVTRGIHLEVVRSLSTQDFLLALRRFSALCGKPRLIVSDNARQFKLADQVLARVWKDLERSAEVQDFSSCERIEWKYITERAPWMGGFYERLVGLVKNALKKVLGQWTIKPDELRTIAYEVAAMLNSRPLVYSDDDPGDKVITPLHLMFRSPDQFPDGSAELDMETGGVTAKELLQHWRAGQNLLSEFWKMWRTQYLTSLREVWRHQQPHGSSDIIANPGTVVLIKDDLPRGRWQVARIERLIQSKDGSARTAEVRLPNGHTLLRAVKMLYPLESSVDCESTPDTGNQPDGTSVQTQPNTTTVSRPRRQAAVKAAAKIRRDADE
jgi:hypothetical protein